MTEQEIHEMDALILSMAKKEYADLYGIGDIFDDCINDGRVRAFQTGFKEALRWYSSRADLLPLRKCANCGTEFKSHGRCPECNPM